jgi:hypothetical protein
MGAFTIIKAVGLTNFELTRIANRLTTWLRVVCWAQSTCSN